MQAAAIGGGAGVAGVVTGFRAPSWAGPVALVSTLVVCRPHVLVAADDGRRLRDAEYVTSARQGIHHLHNLEYEAALETFSELESRFPENPGPPLDLASTIWLKELFRRRELSLEKFVSPGYFTEENSDDMPERQQEEFFRNMERSQELSKAFLEKHPGDQDARFFLGAAEGILGSFAITIEGSKTRAFRHGKKAYRYHKELLEEDPSYYDAYLTVGLYEYVVDNLPWYIKWIATLAGYRGSEVRGFEYLETVANEGKTSVEQAEVMLMALYFREERYRDALDKARQLHDRFPKNFLLHLNRAQILEELDRIRRAGTVYLDVIRLAEQGRPNYHKLPLGELSYELGRKFLGQRWYSLALEQFERVAGGEGTEESNRALAHLQAGKLSDRLGHRARAHRHYRRVLALKEVHDSHDQARDHLEQADHSD